MYARIQKANGNSPYDGEAQNLVMEPIWRAKLKHALEEPAAVNSHGRFCVGDPACER